MNRLLRTVVMGLAGIQGLSLAAESRPKLVVGIMVDQLRTDYLESLKDMLGPGGFKRLMDQGIYLKDVDFKLVPEDATAAAAIIQTGAYPRETGISGSMVYDPTMKSLKPVFSDEAFLGNSTDEKFSPAALRVTSLTDALSIEEGGKSRIHSIAPSAGTAIVFGGHTGNSAFWLNDETGRWASTTFYTDLPSILQEKNYTSPLISRLDTLKWTPLKAGEPYPYVSPQNIKDGFKYSFTRSDRDVFYLYKTSPLINRDITDAAVEYVTELDLGRNKEGTDVLNLAYTLAPYPMASSETYNYELQDAYLRLDRDLERLFDSIDKHAGKLNVLVYLVSSGYFDEPAVDTKKYRLPGGTFSVKRAMSLLGAYLSAKYGNGAYVDQYANSQVYLSKKALEEKGLDPVSVAEDARDFLVRMSGVSDAFTLGDLASPALPELEAKRLSIDPKTAGDIILQFSPGWKVVDDSRFPNVELPNKSTSYSTPGFILGYEIEPQVVETPVDATAISPTIARALRIRAPNAAKEKPLSLKKN